MFKNFYIWGAKVLLKYIPIVNVGAKLNLQMNTYLCVGLNVLWNSRGISVHAFEFRQAENLSAQHRG